MPETAPVLVTGGAGYIGSHTVLALCDAGRAVVVVDDLSAGRRELVPAGVPLVVGNVGDAAVMADVFARFAPAAVIHFAASIVNEESLRRPLAYYRNNVAESLGLIESCVAAGVSRFVFSSSAAVYGDTGGVPATEDMPAAPITPYGRSKWMVESILADVAAASGLSYAALRYFNAAGADAKGRSGPGTGESTHLIKIACEAAVGKRDWVSIFGTDYDTPDGTCIRDYVHVSDLAEAHVAALDRLAATEANLTLNVGYGHGYSVREVLRMVAERGAPGLAIREAGRRPGDTARIVADNARIRATLDWRPRCDDLALIVDSALAWERAL